MPGPLYGSPSTAALPHVDSPAERHLEWQSALDRIAFPARVSAVRRAIAGANTYLPRALIDATGHELHQIVAGILPGILVLMAGLAATTALGAGVGAAIGALAFGIGAAPGAAAGAGLGFEAGIAILDFLGLAFLAAYIGKSLGKATKLAAQAVVMAWESVERASGPEQFAVNQASKIFADAAAELLRGVLQGIVAFLLAKGTAAVAGRVPEIVAKLRQSKLGAGFAEWIERNWAQLVENPKLRTAPAAKEAAMSPAVSEATPTPNKATPRSQPEPPPKTGKAVKSRTETQLDEMYTKAPAAKAEIDAIAQKIADQTGGTVAKAPLKSRARALEKSINDYESDASRVNDLARNTIVVEQSQYAKAVSLLKEQAAKIKTIDATTDPLGYSGTNAIIKTRAGISAEIQVNTPEMIYAK